MLKRKIAHLFYKLAVKLKSEEWVTYYILKQDKTPTIKGLEIGIKTLKKARKKPKKEYLAKLKQAKKEWKYFKQNNQNDRNR